MRAKHEVGELRRTPATVHLTADLFLYVQGLAKIHGLSQSQAISLIIAEHLELAGKKVKKGRK